MPASLSPWHPSLGERIGFGISGMLAKTGMSQWNANRLGSRLLDAISNLTPVGNATMAADAGTAIRQGHPFKGAGLGALAVLPIPGAAKKFGKGMFGNAIRAWHGSPHDFDHFDMSKIGTGDGSGAYARGLYFAQRRDVAENYRDMLSRRSNSPGHLYEVDLHAKPTDFIDWHAPLHEQPKAAQDIIAAVQADRIAREPMALRFDQVGGTTRDGGRVEPGSGAAAYKYLAAPRYGLTEEDASKTLLGAGIPGVRFKDWWDAPGDWRGTHNYVAFDPSIIDIRNKY